MTSNHDETAGIPSDDFRLGDVRVYPDRLLIEYGAEAVRLEPRVMEILTLLAHSGGTVSREQLRDRLWDAYVTDDAIHRAVSKLRKALGPHADLIETVPKRGYRATVSACDVDATVGAHGAPRASATSRPANPALGRAHQSSGALLRRLLPLAVPLSVVFLVWLLAGRPDADQPAGDAEAARTAAAAGADDPDFQPFTALPGYESHPSIDNPGKAVVFGNFPKEGPDAFQWDLWSKPLAGGEAIRLTETPEHEINPSVSPAGRLVAFARMEGGRCEIVVWDRDADARAALPGGCGVSRGPTDCCAQTAWIDEDRLLVSRRETVDGPKRLYEIGWRDGGQRLVTDPPAQWYGDTAMAVSADGGRVALVRQRAPEIADLWLLDLVSGDTRQLTRDGYPISGVTFSADDRALLYARNRTGTTTLWRIDVPGGAAQLVPTVGMNASWPVAGDGVLLYEEWKSEINVWQVEPATGVGEALIVSTRWDWRARPSPDGHRIAFVSNRGGAPEVWLAQADGSGARMLTRLGAGIASVPVWAPDGEQVVIAAPVAGSLDILAVDVADGSIEALVSDASDEREPVFSRDGKHLFFASNRGGSWDLWRLTRDSGELSRWTTDGGVAARPAVDGAGAWHVRLDVPGLWWQEAPGQPPTLVDADFQPAAPSDWTVTDAGIYYLRFDDQYGGWLSRFDPVTGAREDITALEGEGGIGELFAGGGLWVAPDGSRALLASVDLSHSDLWIGR